MLGRRGYSTGSIDGGYGAFTATTVRRFQAAAGLTADGRAGSGTLSALRNGTRRTSAGLGSTTPVSTGTPSGAISFLRPLNVPMGDGFGYPPGRGGRRHDGIDFPAPTGTSIGAAGVGTVLSGRWNSGGYGNLLVIQHRLGYQTWYAHLSGFAVSVGQRVSGGTTVAYVGSTGHSSGPHLHFEVRLNGVPINPAPLLLARSSLAKLAAGPFPRRSVCRGADRTRFC
jgi:murein DD-endopeptidase MepM/ murein hydrolase activator NlpD